MIHTRSKIIAAIAGAVFLGTLLIYGGMLWVVEGQKKELLAERLHAAEVEGQRLALSRLTSMVAETKEDRGTLRAFILEDANIIELLSLIEETAREQGLSLTTDKLTVVPIDTFEELHVSFTMVGPFDRVMRMLRILETLPLQSSILNISLSKTGETSSTWQANLDFKVTKFKKI